MNNNLRVGANVTAQLIRSIGGMPSDLLLKIVILVLMYVCVRYLMDVVFCGCMVVSEAVGACIWEVCFVKQMWYVCVLGVSHIIN